MEGNLTFSIRKFNVCFVFISFLLANSQITFAQSLQFNGTSQYGRVANNASLQLRSFTIEMWIKPEGTGGTVSANGTGNGGVLNTIPLLTKGIAENESAAIDVNYYLGIKQNGANWNLIADFEDNINSSNHPITGGNSIQLCKWQHVAATYNDTTGVWVLFVNGVQDATLTLSAAFKPQNLSTVNLAFGAGVNSTNATSGFFAGKMDEIRVWDRVRTATEILANKDLEITGGTNLVARYGLNENTGTTVSSSVGGAGLNASLQNTPVWTNQFLAKAALDFDGTNDYVTFGAAPSLGLANYTLESWIKIEGAGVLQSTTGSGGLSNVIPIVTKGRDENDGSNVDMNFYLGIKQNGSNWNVVADFEEGGGGSSPGQNHPIQGSVNFQMNTWVHIACTYNGTDLKLYVNGVLDATLTVGQPCQSGSIQHAGLGTAMNSSGTTSGFFNGKMDEVRIWDFARTQADISSNYLSEITTAAGLVGRWSMDEACGQIINSGTGSGLTGTVSGAIWVPMNFNAAPLQPSNIAPAHNQVNVAGNQVTVTVTDPEAKPMTVKLYGRKKTNNAAIPNFVIIGLPDTQMYTEEPQGLSGAGGGHNGIFKAQTQWIKDRRVDSNIVFVIQLGDCTQNGELNEIEWKRADTAIKIIENPSVPVPDGIPYSICVGNHDQGNAAGSPTAPTTRYNQYFGSSRFSTRGYYGGFFGSNYDNHYELFSASGIDFIHISIEYNNNSGTTNQTALQNVLNWADALLKAHPTRKAIISSHWFMGLGINGSFGGPGQKVYDELKDNPNLILMLCGHIHGEGRRTDVYNGSTVHTVLSDYQSYPNGGNGFLRIMQFKPSENVVTFKTYSPTINGTGGFQTGPDSEFSLPVDFGGTSFALLGTNTGVTSGSGTSFTWNGLLPASTYEWYVTIDDGENVTTSSVFQFTTAGSLPLKLVNLKAINEKYRVKLDWTTTDEVNTKEFEIEKSIDGHKFSMLDIVTAKGSGGFNHYEFFDEKPAPDKSFYRLKIKDNDGKFAHSKIVIVNRNKKGGFEVIPNPSVNNEIRIIWNSDNKEEIRISVYDAVGRLHLKRSVIATGNEIVLKHALLPGIYNVDLVTKDAKHNKQIVVR